MTTRNNSFYKIVDASTWDIAEANSIALGGHLVTINDADENAFIRQILEDNNKVSSWIGYKYDSTSDSWSWQDGSSSTYTNWDSVYSQPDISINPTYGLEYYGSLITGISSHPYYSSWGGNGGTWHDTFNSGNDFALSVGLAEVPLSYFSISDLTITEGESGNVTISRTGGTSTVQNLTLSISGSASAGSDYSSISQTVSFAAGETSKAISISTIDDSTYEGNETISLTIAASGTDDVPPQLSNGGSSMGATVTISDNDGIINGTSFYRIVNGPSWTEAEANAVALGGHLVTINDAEENEWIFSTFEEVLVGTSEGLGLMIGFTDSEEEGAWKWSSGELVTYTNWGTNQPSNSRGLENHSVLGGDNGTWNDIQEDWWNLSGVSTQKNDVKGLAEVPLSYFSISDLTITEGESGNVTISRTGGTSTVQNLTLTSSNGSATAGSDYSSASQTISFAAGETSKTISISTIDDSTYEGDETFSLTIAASGTDDIPPQLSNSGSALSNTVTISDNDGIINGTSWYKHVKGPTWNDAEANAVALGGHLVTINDATENQWLVDNLSGFDYFYLDNYGTDFYRDSYWIGFTRSGTTFSWIDGTTWDYSNFGTGEPAYNGSYGEISLITKSPDWAQTAGNWNDESALNPHYGIAEVPLSYFSISDLTITEGESGDVTISRTGGTSTVQNLTLSSSDISATGGSDYTAINQNVSFAKGETSKTISINSIDDSSSESAETFKLTISASSNDEVTAQISDSTAIITINDDNDDDLSPLITGPSGHITSGIDAGLTGSSISIDENTSNVFTFTANETVTWDFDDSALYGYGGRDVSKFSINSTSGALSFLSSPDYENPTDYDANNDYVVVVRASDAAGNKSVQTVTITIDDVNENILEGSPLTGSISQGLLYDIYKGEGGANAIKNLNLLDTNGDNTISATNKIDDNLYYYSFAIDNSDIETGLGDDVFNIKNYRGYYAIGLKDSEIKSGDGADKINIDLLEDNFYYGAFAIEDSSIDSGSGNDEVKINLTSSRNDAFTSYALKNSSIDLGSGDDILEISQKNSSENLDIAISGDVSTSVRYDFGSGNDIGSFTSQGYGLKGSDNNFHKVILGSGNDTFTVDSVYSAFYKSNLFADEGNDEIKLTSSNQLNYGTEDSNIYLGEGDDVISIDSSKNTTIDGGDGFDEVKLLDNYEEYQIESDKYDTATITKLNDGFFKLDVTNLERITFNNKSIFIGESADETAPSITGPSGHITSGIDAGLTGSSISIDENTSNVFTFTANETVTWDFDDSALYGYGGRDVSKFSINSTSGALSFLSSPDYENPTDYDANNDYVVVVRASDAAGNRSVQTVTISIDNVNENTLMILGPSGIAGDISTSKAILENTTKVHTFLANDFVTWSLSGGIDKDLFSIDSSTGTLTFENAPDYESPSDSNKDNSYIVDIRASDSDNNIADQTVTVLIADVDELTSSPKYSIFTDINVPQENYLLTTTAQTSNVAAGTKLYWSVSGTNINLADFSSGSMNGEGTVGNDGSFSFQHLLANDGLTEGYETIDIKLFSDNSLSTQLGITKSILIRDSAITEQIAELDTQLNTIKSLLTVGQEYSLSNIRDYDGNLHATTSTVSTTVSSSYKYQGMLDVNTDGTKEAIYTNKESGRWVTASVNSTTGLTDFSDYGKNGTTRIVGIYIDPLVQSGEVIKDSDFDSQRRFQTDLVIDNLLAKTAGDYDSDGFQEVYWKTADGTAYLRALMHDDGNIQYANYQSESQMTEYLTANGFSSTVSEIIS